ncbi:AAEL013540-PA [Aedes aegypti]|nr:AAEL013540-PA [Aedes aegypti]
MSDQYDIFDNLNSYLNADDDVDFAEDELEAECRNLDDQVPDPDEIPPPIKQKRAAKGTQVTTAKPEPAPVPRRRSQRLTAAATEAESTDDEGLSSGSTTSLLGPSSSHSSLKSQPSEVRSVDLSGDDLDEQLKEVQRQYDLIFNNPACTGQDKRYFAGLKRRFQTMLKRKNSPRGRSATFMQDFESLKETLYNICINWNLMAARSVASRSTSNGSIGDGRSTRRARRQQQLEVINLVDSPALILPGTINLDSDEDDVAPAASNRSANLSFDSENYEVSLKIKWEGKIERFSHRKFQKFGDLIAVLAERAGADPSHVVLDLDERIIEPDDTPDSIGYRISQFIAGRVVRGELAEVFAKKKKSNATGLTSKAQRPKDANEIALKVQSDRWKKPLEVKIRKDNKMMILIIKCAEELKCQPGDIKLSFDGDPVALDSTPVDLELEGGEILDLRFLKG